jgi:hypothetical protein
VNSILNFGRLDTVPGDLELVVDTPHEMEQSVGVSLNCIARAVPSGTVRAGCKGVAVISRVKVT